MTRDRREDVWTLPAGPWRTLSLISLAGWTLLALAGQGLAITSLCAGEGWRRLALGLRGLDLLGATLPALLLDAAPGWCAMLLAMTPLLLVRPLRRLLLDSPPGRSWANVAAFSLGYGFFWGVAGVLFVTAAAILLTLLGDLAMPAALLVALGWRAFPVHARPAPRAGARGGRRDALRHGLDTAAWCLVACWPLMLLPLVAQAWHWPVMIAAWLVMLWDRRLGRAGGDLDQSLRTANV